MERNSSGKKFTKRMYFPLHFLIPWGNGRKFQWKDDFAGRMILLERDSPVSGDPTSLLMHREEIGFEACAEAL